jgi:hypothetical protein
MTWANVVEDGMSGQRQAIVNHKCIMTSKPGAWKLLSSIDRDFLNLDRLAR